METAETQVKAVELNNNTSEIDQVSKTAGKYSSKYREKQEEVQLYFKRGKQWPICTANIKGEVKSKKLCFNCGSAWPHPAGNSKCPAQGKTCRKCAGVRREKSRNKYKTNFVVPLQMNPTVIE